MTTDVRSPIVLPRGLYDASGVCHRLALLRPIGGHEEMALGDATSTSVSTFLCACLGSIGDFTEVGTEHTTALTRGDRHHLALHLRARLFGDRVSLVVHCPNPSCQAVADMDLRISSIAPERADPVPEVLEVETPLGIARVREPTGTDDAILERAAGSRAERSALLWSRLVLEVGEHSTLTPEAWRALDVETRGTIALALTERGSLPDLTFLAGCPSCGALLEIELDPIDLLMRELRFGAERLLAEIHCLAWYYHWSEAEVLALPRTRRWRYLELLGRQLEGRPLLEPWRPS